MKTYVITGAGSGIGRAITKQLANEGHQCILIGRNQGHLKETIAGLEGSHRIMPADIRSLTDMKALASELQSMAIDGIMANAGIGGENHWGEQDRWHEIVETNLTGTYNLVNSLLPNLKKSETPYKHIIITSSVLARLGVENYSAYCASKAGLLGLMGSAVCPAKYPGECDLSRLGKYRNVSGGHGRDRPGPGDNPGRIS
jgi:NAD(P)-dependent dehydrogenase (short-subunit alcohol dehydrogenase family)